MSNNRPKVAFQGMLGAYSEIATCEYFGNGVEVIPCSSFVSVFDAVTNGNVDHGVIPIENSLAGSIHGNYDLLLEHDLVITGELKLRVVHNLLVNHGVSLGDIKRVYSHPQALSQCKDFLNGLTSVEQISVYDTAAAAARVAESGSCDEAAIASERAAMDYGLDILKSGIESNHKNFTRF